MERKAVGRTTISAFHNYRVGVSKGRRICAGPSFLSKITFYTPKLKTNKNQTNKQKRH